MADGGAAPPESSGHARALAARQNRFLGREYADISKLREIAARHDRAAARAQQRASRINTKIDKLRHQATLLREKSQAVLARVPEFEQQIKQHQKDVDAASGRSPGAPLTSDVTGLHYRIRKIQQKIVDLQQKAKNLELKAASKNQKTQELKVEAARYQERAGLSEQEATTYRKRADRLQLAIEQDGGRAPTGDAAPPAPASDASEPPSGTP
ncbi:MAG TPA: hypothetical protein VMG36_06965 [Thermoplasmata archaeon]|nr:hypothetical protein [Thermoplasmata archaeon]